MTIMPLWRRPVAVLGTAGGMYASVFAVRVAQIVDVEAADTLLAAPIALVAVAFGIRGGIVAAVIATLVFTSAEALDDAPLTADEVAVRAVGFTALGWFVGAAAALLERTRARFVGAFDNAPNGVLLTDLDGRVVAASRAAAAMLRRDRAHLVGGLLAELSHPFDVAVDEVQWAALRAGEMRSYTVERQLVDGSGEPVPVIMSVARMPSRFEPAPVIVHIVDMTAQRRSEEQLAYLADHDPLTGLLNRGGFDRELREHLRRVARHGPTGAVLLLDLDHFKYVNDTLGHAVGDVVLKAVADGLASRLRTGDSLARLGGDEFAVLLPDARDEADVRTAAAEILAFVNGLRVPIPGDLARLGDDVHVTASVGAVLVPALGSADRLLIAADLAMYEAKEAGRGQARLHAPGSPHAERIRAGFTWRERIRQGLLDSRFELYLQPIVALTGDPEPRFEALLRLHDDARLWHPAEFLRHAERLGLMADIDEHVIDTAIRLLAEQPPNRRPRLEVNLSAVSLGDAHLAERVADKLRRHGVAEAHLIFEITETVAIANLPLAARTIRQLRSRGCGFALDDFGVGVSSFYYLRELPFDILKIDGEFVRDLAGNRSNQVIVRAMIDTAHGLGKATVAEFVESQDVADTLRRLGCDFAQGHLFGRPLPVAEALRAWARGVGALDSNSPRGEA